MTRLMVINYDLRPDAMPQDYQRLASALSSLGAKRLCLSSWAIRSPLTPMELGRAIWTYLDANRDRLLVVEVGAHAEFNTEQPLETI